MNKKMSRLLCLVLCAIMVCGMLSVTAQAAVTENERGGYEFTTFADLKQLASQSYDDGVYVICNGDLVIEENLTLPENLFLEVYGTLTVPAGVTLSAAYTDVYCFNLKVSGTLVNNGFVTVGGDLTVTGSVTNNNYISVYPESKIVGADKISNENWGAIVINYDAVSTEGVLNAIAAANDSDYYYNVNVYDGAVININQSATIPSNVWLTLDNTCELNIAKGGTLTNYGEVYLYSNATVYGTLDNCGYWILDCYEDEVNGGLNGTMTLASGGVYSGTGMIDAYGNGCAQLAQIVPGFDLSDFDVTYYNLETWGDNWELWLKTEPDQPLSGTCGANLTWSFDEATGTLTISGTGPMTDYDGISSFAPWYGLRDVMQNAVIEKGVTSIGANAFYDAALSTISIPDTVTSIGESAFEMSDLTSINIPRSVTSIGNMAFFYGLDGTITFEGDAPAIAEDAFSDVVVTAYYHQLNDTWTDAVMQQYHGTITWVPYVFSDVRDGAWYCDAVLWAVDKDITNGYEDTTLFGTFDDCTRAQVVTFLYRYAGSPTPTSSSNPFADVPDNKWYTDAVLWAVEEGITNGKGDGTVFNPNEVCTRAEIVTFLYRFAGSPELKSSDNPFVDVAEGKWYTNAILWAAENGITKGHGSVDTFKPDQKCTRGEIVTFLHRYGVPEVRVN